MKKTLIKTQFTRQGLTRSHQITFNEPHQGGFKKKSFDCPKEHLEFHLQQLKKMCSNVKVQTRSATE